MACYNMCKQLAFNGVNIQFIVPYTAEHNIDFMEVTASHPQDVTAVLESGNTYESKRFLHVKTDGSTESHSLYDQYRLYADNVGKLVDLYEFDIIHAHDWLTFGAGIEAKRKTGKPLIVHVHSTEYDRSGGNNGNQFVREIEYEAMMMADKIIAVSQATRSVISEQYKIPLEKIEVVHNSINFNDLPCETSTNVYHYLDVMKQHGYKVVTNVGRLTIQKGLTHLLEAAQKVVQKDPKTLFLIVGSGDQYEELIELSANLGISANVLFAGFQRGKAWQDAFSIADLFVMPSVSEPFGLAPLESIVFGTPALVSKQSGVAEVIDNLLSVDFWDIDEMANQIYAVLHYDALAKEMLLNSQREVKNLSWSDAAGKFVDIYNNLLGATT